MTTMKLNSQIRIIVTSTDVKKIDLEIKKLKLLLEGKTLTKVTVFVKKKKQKFYTVLKSPQKYKRAKNTYCSYIYEAMLSTKMDLNSNLSLILLSHLKGLYIQNTNIGFKILTKVVKTTEINKSLKLSTKLQNRFFENKKRKQSNIGKRKLEVISKETADQHINLFVNKFIKYIKLSKRKKLRKRVVKACTLDSLARKPKQESKAKMIINQKLKQLKRKKAIANKKSKKLKTMDKNFRKKNYKSKNKMVAVENKFQLNATKSIKNVDHKIKQDKTIKPKVK